MNILFISGELIGSALVHKLLREGHNLKLYIEHVDRKTCFEGIADKVTDWKNELDWVGKDGLIIFDDVIFGEIPDELRLAGYTVFGGDSKSSELELNRELFHTILEKNGISVLPSHDFETASEAIDFVRENIDVWVVKQSSHIGMLNYVGQREDAKDVLDILEIYKKKNISPVHLQKKASGVEIGVGRYFNGTDWVGPIEINLEHKPLCNGDLGPLTAEMGTVMWFTEDEKCKLYQETLVKLKSYLTAIHYKGDFEMNCIVTKDNVWPLEATVRLGTPALELQIELLEVNWGEFLHTIASGEKCTVPYSNGYGIVVSAMVPPFPYAPEVFGDSNIETNQGAGIFFSDDITPNEKESIHFEEAAIRKDLDDNEHLYLAGKHGYAAYVTGKGTTIAEAQNSVYSTLKKLVIPKMFYRTDIGDTFKNIEYQQLIDWGWINE